MGEQSPEGGRGAVADLAELRRVLAAEYDRMKDAETARVWLAAIELALRIEGRTKREENAAPQRGKGGGYV